MKRMIFLIVTVLALTSCNQQIADFIENGERKQTLPPESQIDAPLKSTSNPIANKVSPMASRTEGNDVRARIAITPWRRSAEGTQVKATFSFSQNRPE